MLNYIYTYALDSSLLLSSWMAGWVSGMVKSFGGAVSVNMTGMLDNTGLPCFSSSLIQESRESLDDVPEI